MAVIPEVSWVHPVIEIGGLVVAAITTFGLWKARTAVDGVNVQMVVTAVPLHDARIKVLEEAKLVTQAKVEAIDEKTDIIDKRTFRMSEQLNQLIGKIEAMGSRR